MRLDIEAVERRINSAFFVDLFLAISNMEGIQPRNQLDLAQRNEERLVQLGPVLERLHGEFLTHLIDRVFNQALRAQILPEAPQDLQGTDLKVRFISTLAMAQRSVVTADIERLSLFTSNLVAGGWETALDKFDADQAIDEYSKAIGVPPQVVLSDDAVANIRAQRQQQIEQQQLLEAAQSAAQTAKTVADTDTEGKNALTDLIE